MFLYSFVNELYTKTGNTKIQRSPNFGHLCTMGKLWLGKKKEKRLGEDNRANASLDQETNNQSRKMYQNNAFAYYFEL